MKQPIPLCRAALPQLPSHVARPTYGLPGVRPGIVHLGLGGFHRAHMARYTHDLMQLIEAREWGIVGIGLLPQDRRMHAALTPQDALYTLVERDQTAETATVVGSLSEVIFAGESSVAALQAIERPTSRIVSLTITENGYCLNSSTKELDFSNPFIVRDLADPRRPHTAIGMLVEGYRRRRDAGEPPMTALSCDNIPHNGAILRGAVLSFAQSRDPDLARWIETNASFPNTMVDRITPTTAPADIEYLGARYHVRDRWPVFSETFRQWVIEDTFTCGRPAWERVGAQFTADVAPYEFMKLRLLNASHLALAGLGRLAGYSYIHEVVGDPDFRAYMQVLMDRETGPTLPEIAGVDLTQYKSTLISRFANESIKDTVDRVNADAPINLLIDPIRARLQKQEDTPLLALALAAWMKRLGGLDDAGLQIAVVHPQTEILRLRAAEGGPDPRPLLAVKSVFGDLNQNLGFIGTLQYWLRSIYEIGAKATVMRARKTLGF